MDAGAEAKIEKSDVEIWCQDSTKFDFWNMILEIGYTHVLVSNLVRRGFRGQKTLKEMSGGSFNIFFTWLERKRMQDYWVLVERHSFLGLVSNGLQGSTSQLANPNSKKKPMFGVSLINRQTQGLARAALETFFGCLVPFLPFIGSRQIKGSANGKTLFDCAKTQVHEMACIHV